MERDQDISFSSSSEEYERDEDTIEFLSEFVKMASDSNVIILDKWEDMDVKLIRELLDEEQDFIYPDCALCLKPIFFNTESFLFNNKRYLIHFKSDFREISDQSELSDMKDLNIEGMKCRYCSNYFHRHKCSLQMSNLSYRKAISYGRWSCPNCVPEFDPWKLTNFKDIKH